MVNTEFYTEVYFFENIWPSGRDFLNNEAFFTWDEAIFGPK